MRWIECWPPKLPPNHFAMGFQLHQPQRRESSRPSPGPWGPDGLLRHRPVRRRDRHNGCGLPGCNEWEMRLRIGRIMGCGKPLALSFLGISGLMNPSPNIYVGNWSWKRYTRFLGQFLGWILLGFILLPSLVSLELSKEMDVACHRYSRSEAAQFMTGWRTRMYLSPVNGI